MTPIKAFIRKLLKWTRSEYACYRIYRTVLASYEVKPPVLPPAYRLSPVTQAEVLQATHPEMAEQAGFGGRESIGFAVLRGRDIVSILWAWYGNRYREERNFWPLGPKEAKIVQTFTIPDERGHGFAMALAIHCTYHLRDLGFERSYSRVWWNNHASITVTERAGRTHIATVLELRLFGAGPLRFVRRHYPC